MGAGGLLIGMKGVDRPSDLWAATLVVIWAAGIGFGFGSIFDEGRPSKLLVVYWALTLALVGPFFGVLAGALLQTDTSEVRLFLPGVLGALAGAFLGLLVGTLQFSRRRAKLRDSPRATAP